MEPYAIGSDGSGPRLHRFESSGGFCLKVQIALVRKDRNTPSPCSLVDSKQTSARCDLWNHELRQKVRADLGGAVQKQPHVHTADA